MNGNSALIIEIDLEYAQQIARELKILGAQVSITTSLSSAKSICENQDFDLVISSYYLPDGLILNFIDWCRSNLNSLPVFVSIGTSMESEKDILQRHSISDSYRRHDIASLLKGIRPLLFDKSSLKQSLIDMRRESGIDLELFVEKKNFKVTAIEVSGEGMLLDFSEIIKTNSPGILRLSIVEQLQTENFLFMGIVELRSDTGSFFMPAENYLPSWKRLITRLESKQINVIKFLTKVVGR